MIQPALSAEEWARAFEQAKMPWANGDIRANFTEFEGSTTEGLHGLAALALHGQPFGFTADHVRAILSSLYYVSGGSLCPVCADPDDGWKMSSPPICVKCGFQPFRGGEYRKLAKEAADRIAALLPPREPK